MADPMGDLWSKTAMNFKARVYDYLNRVDIKEEDRKKLEGIPRVIDDFIKVPRNPTTLYTRDNLVKLVECWNVFSSWTYGTRYWNKEFPEWSFMITQFQIFVNEFEMKEVKELLHTTGGVDVPTGRQTTRMSELLELMRVG
jgi:hypothetical protein